MCKANKSHHLYTRTTSPLSQHLYTHRHYVHWHLHTRRHWHWHHVHWHLHKRRHRHAVTTPLHTQKTSPLSHHPYTHRHYVHWHLLTRRHSHWHYVHWHLHTRRHRHAVTTPLHTDDISTVTSPPHTQTLRPLTFTHTPTPTRSHNTSTHTDEISSVTSPLHTDDNSTVTSPLHTDTTSTDICPAHVVQWSNHLRAMCSRAWRSQWPRIDSSLGPGASAYYKRIISNNSYANDDQGDKPGQENRVLDGVLYKLWPFVSDIAIFLLKRDVKLQLTT